MSCFLSAPPPKTAVELNISSWDSTGTLGVCPPSLRTTVRLTQGSILLRTPCGFCFVEYYTHAEALACLRYISGTKLDERIIRCDLDVGYRDGRQFGRGKSGGQVGSTFHVLGFI